jgi:hypothetical protein
MNHDNGEPQATALRAKARELFACIDSAEARRELRQPGSKLASLSSTPPLRSSTYRFPLRPGCIPAHMLIQAEWVGSKPRAEGGEVFDEVALSCYPQSNEALLRLARLLGYAQARAEGRLAKVVVPIGGSLTQWEKMGLAASSVASLLAEACLREESDLAASEAEELRKAAKMPTPIAALDDAVEKPRPPRAKGL